MKCPTTTTNMGNIFASRRNEQEGRDDEYSFMFDITLRPPNGLPKFTREFVRYRMRNGIPDKMFFNNIMSVIKALRTRKTVLYALHISFERKLESFTEKVVNFNMSTLHEMADSITQNGVPWRINFPVFYVDVNLGEKGAEFVGAILSVVGSCGYFPDEQFDASERTEFAVASFNNSRHVNDYLRAHAQEIQRGVEINKTWGRCLLITGGENGYASTSTLIYDVTSNSFEKGAKMKIARSRHASTTLSDGQVFICGGHNGKDRLSSCESFDAKTNTFTEIGNMNVKRNAHAAVTLPDNRVFIVGGYDGPNLLHSAETFDPITKKFNTCEGRTTIERWGHTANLLSNERVLVCGGSYGSTLQSTEFYDIETDSFSAGPDLTVSRDSHASTTLLDGRILITGGENGDPSKSTEFYDPKTNSFVAGPQMLEARCNHSSSLLEDGRVLIIGGGDSGKGVAETTEIYDPKTNSFTTGRDIPSDRYDHSSSPFVREQILPL